MNEETKRSVIMELQEECYRTAKDNGYYYGLVSMTEELKGIAGEVIEAQDAATIYRYCQENEAPNTLLEIAEELSDIVIRCLSFAGHHKINLACALEKKMEKNNERANANIRQVPDAKL